VINLKIDKAKFTAVLIPTYTLLLPHRLIFLCVRMNYNFVFVKCCSILHCKFVYLWRTTSYCLYNTLLDPWNVCTTLSDWFWCIIIIIILILNIALFFTTITLIPQNVSQKFALFPFVEQFRWVDKFEEAVEEVEAFCGIWRYPACKKKDIENPYKPCPCQDNEILQ